MRTQMMNIVSHSVVPSLSMNIFHQCTAILLSRNIYFYRCSVTSWSDLPACPKPSFAFDGEKMSIKHKISLSGTRFRRKKKPSVLLPVVRLSRFYLLFLSLAQTLIIRLIHHAEPRRIIGLDTAGWSRSRGYARLPRSHCKISTDERSV